MTADNALTSFEKWAQRKGGRRTARVAFAVSLLSLLGTAVLGMVLVAPQYLPMQVASSALDARLRSTNERLDRISAELEQLRRSREEQDKVVGALRQELDRLRDSTGTVSPAAPAPSPARRTPPTGRR